MQFLSDIRKNHPGLWMWRFFLSTLLAMTLTGYQLAGQSKADDEESDGPNILVTAEGQARPIPMVGFNNNVLNSPLQDPTYRDTIASLHPELLRYPGGTVSDYFDWRSGWVDDDQLPPDHFWRTLEEMPVRPDSLLQYLDDIEARPFFTLNALHSTLAEQRALLRHVQSLGDAVEFVELGNEYYFGHPRFAKVYPTAQDYGRAMNQWIDSLRVETPDAEMCVIGASPVPNAGERRLTWNERLFPMVEKADAACFHPYFSAPAGAREGAAPIETLMAVPFRRWQQFQAEELAVLPSDWEAWITEYNLFAPEQKGVRTTWTHAMMTTFYTLLLMKAERVTVLLPHQIAGNPSFAAVEVRPPFTAPQPYSVTAYGNAMRFVFGALQGTRIGRPLQFSPQSEITVDRSAGSITYPQLVGWKLDDGALLLNVGTTAQTVDLSGVSPGSTVRHLFAENALTPGLTTDDLTMETSDVEGPVSLPPLSIMHVSPN